MEKGSKLTLVGLAVIVGCVLFVILIALPVLEKVRRIATHVVCTTNLKSLGTAITVYSDDHDDLFPQLPGEGPWSKRLGFDYDLANPDFSSTGAEDKVSRTITASWYLLVREADVSPKTFICPYSETQQFDGFNPQKKDIVELWDFGSEPHNHVDYAYHNPYGKYPANESRSAAFAIAADMSPWFVNGNFVSPGSKEQAPQIITFGDKSTWRLGVGQFHNGEGQKVLFADGHSSYETQPNVGVKHDNIYTFWSAEENPTEQDRQGGTAPTSRSGENDAKHEDDSFLAI